MLNDEEQTVQKTVATLGSQKEAYKLARSLNGILETMDKEDASFHRGYESGYEKGSVDWYKEGYKEGYKEAYEKVKEQIYKAIKESLESLNLPKE